MTCALTHRAAVERNTASGTNAWGQPAVPVFTARATLACRAWSKTRKEVRDDGLEVLIEDIRALFADGADIQTGDRISSITDRRAGVVFSGPLAVQAISRRGQNARHREAVLTRHQ